MLNIKAIVLALVISLLVPTPVSTAPNNDNVSCWWAMLYPQLCGNENLPAGENDEVEIAFKILEIL